MWETTTTRPSEAYLAPGRTEPRALGYGYLMWLLPGTRRQFAPIGFLGQRILVDPASKLIMVQTAVENSNEIGPLWSDVVKTFGG
jgi:CubicO group peptidase (beta-lactamase class C family)